MRLLPQGETPSTGHFRLVVTDFVDPKPLAIAADSLRVRANWWR